MKNYIPKSTKSAKVQHLVNEALDILDSVGIPVNTKSERGAEKMAQAFLAVANVTEDWTTASDNTHLQTRQIITFVNKHFEETISSGSYDDIRRKDLKLLVIADLIVNSGDKLSAATNDPTRGYALHSDFKNLVVQYKTTSWVKSLAAFNATKPSLADLLERKRNIEQIPVSLPGGKPLNLSLGEHNVLQKAVIEQFLPRFGSDCHVLYIGDTSNKMLHIEEEELARLAFFKLSHDELPDIIAYSEKNNWLYLIEAVHSSGPMSEIRVHELKKLLKDCRAELIFVTAFLTRTDFRKWVMNIAWETEVWIADNPDHLIHFNGHKFLGAY
ncbi:BsuBI/PstI family type II restriction endonuclease [Spirosoma spitsbergense]|uniref:BsuBI/PstI family type II restriction endonuclease n=1 Tax=Spirosoma spitsbergense TaxID=431554 RepID=UPI00036790F7|nr:BsuBI/PstI family type II restriction endonuclease [Spirosoma spitsbergense]